MIDLNKMTIKELKEFAAKNNLDLFKITGKQNIITTIQNRLYTSALLGSPEYVIGSLINYSGSSRMEKINATEGLYYNKEKAKKWYYSIAKVIHPDKCKLENCEIAFFTLNMLYKNMTK